jgi:hypothetical protein
MKRASLVLIFAALVLIQAASCVALSDYQKGVLDGLSKGWSMAQKYDMAIGGDSASYNQAVPGYNSWIEAIFGRNESMMLKVLPGSRRTEAYAIGRTFTPVHSIDESWNQTNSLLPDPDASGLIGGYPAETYYSIGPALANF